MKYKTDLIKQIKKIVTLFIYTTFIHTCVFAQQGVVVTGGNTLGLAGTVSYTIGQIDYISFGNAVIISQGVQQVYDKLIVVVDDKISITVWPNPVVNELHIQVKDPNGSGIRYQLYTVDGKLLEGNIISGNQTAIGMNKYAAAVYILLVTHLNNKIISFRIIKK